MSDLALAKPNQDVATALFGDVIEGKVSPEYIRAVNTLSTGQVPKEVIQSHVGPNGKVLYYIAHWWLTEQLNLALPHLWSMETHNPQLHPDGSATVEVVFKYMIPFIANNGETVYVEREIGELGAFKSVNNMADAYKLAAAVSRGLARCMFRAFGIGKELYRKENEFEIPPKQKWNDLVANACRRMGVRLGTPQGDALRREIRDMLGDMALDDLADDEKYAEVYRRMVELTLDKKSVPFDEEKSNSSNGHKPVKEEVTIPAPKEAKKAAATEERIEELITEMGFSPAAEEDDPYYGSPMTEADAVELGNAEIEKELEAASKPQPEPEAQGDSVLLVDPKKEFASWPALEAYLGLLGVSMKIVGPILKQKFGKFEQKDTNKYWKYVATEINSGRLEIHPVGG